MLVSSAAIPSDSPRRMRWCNQQLQILCIVLLSCAQIGTGNPGDERLLGDQVVPGDRALTLVAAYRETQQFGVSASHVADRLWIHAQEGGHLFDPQAVAWNGAEFFDGHGFVGRHGDHTFKKIFFGGLMVL